MKDSSRNSIYAVIGAVALIASAPAYTYQDTGDKEVEFTGGFSHQDGTDVGTLNVDASLGYYVAPRVNVGVRQTLSYSFVDDGNDTWTASTIPFVNYNFDTGNPRFRPFVGAFAGMAYNDDDSTGTMGPALGFKYFVSDNSAFVMRYRYEWYFDDLTFNDATDTADGNHIVTVGLSYLWQ